MGTKFVAGNWKMFTTSETARQLASAVVRGLDDVQLIDHNPIAYIKQAAEAVSRGLDNLQGVAVAVCPPFPYLSTVAEVLKGSRIALGAQNCYHENEGAFTGEVSPAMLVDVGCRYVILGHSERRHKLGETDAFINRKVHAALATGLKVILCLGETLQERQANRTEAVLVTQLDGSLAGLDAKAMRKVVLAYEPVWAIGTGQNATPEQAQQAHAFIRAHICQHFGTSFILYGGSVKPDNAASLFSQADVDGGLIGGASLNADHFLAIVRAAAAAGKS